MANAMPEYGGTVLRPGASGPDIALVQRWLGGLNVDGRYGTSTETAVRRFQREQGLKIDGHVGRPPVFFHIPGMKIRISSHFLNENGQYPYFV